MGITLSGSTIASSAKVGSTIGTAIPLNLLRDLKWDLSDDAGGKFAVDKFGNLTVADILTVGDYNITIEASQANNITICQNFTIHVVKKMLSTSIVFTADIVENAPMNTAVGIATATTPSNTLVWSLLLDAFGKYRIDPITGAVLVNSVLIAKSDIIIIKVSDRAGSYSQTFVIAVKAAV